MRKLITANLVFALLLSLGSSRLSAAEESVLLSNGVSLKVLYFRPHDEGTAPLAILVSGGSNNEFMARAQFWLGRELVERGWAIAVPISPEGRDYFVESPQLFPEIIAHLHSSQQLSPGKTLLVGISSGGSAALAIAVQQPQHYLGVVATPGRLWQESRVGELGGLPVYLRIGEKDSFRWNRNLEDIVTRLHRAGARVDAAIVPDARHIFPLDWDDLESWLSGIQQSR